jgi:hypothetical protein
MAWASSRMIFFGPGLLCFLIHFSGTLCAASSSLPARKTIIIGDTARVRFPGAHRLRISRDGIVHVRRDRGDDWFVTGLSRGVVIIHPEFPDGQETNSNSDTVLEVKLAPTNSSRPSRQSVENDNGSCDPVIAKAASVRYRILMNAVQSSSAGGISPALKMEGHLARMVGSSVASGGSVVEMARGVASIASMDNEGKMRAKIVAEPVVAVFPGAESIVRSGGEFRTDGPVLETDPAMHGQRVGGAAIHGAGWGSGWTAASGWKEYGLSLRTFWDNCRLGNASIQFEIWLTQRVSGQDDHLLAGKISGKKWLVPERMTFGGAIDFALDSGTESGSWWINRIPFVGLALGSIFSRKGLEIGKSKMSVWLTLTRDEGFVGSDGSEKIMQSATSNAAREAVE